MDNDQDDTQAVETGAEKNGLSVRAVSRALAVLRSFYQEGPSLSLTEVASAAKLDKGTARRILLTLVQDGFAVIDPQTQKYSLGLEILKLAGAVPERRDLRQIASTILSRLAKATGSTVFLSVYHDGSAICLDQFHSDRSVEVRWWIVGGQLPMNCGAAPRVLLAYLPEDEVSRVLARGTTRLTPFTTTDPKALMEELEAVRRDGWSVAVDDVYEGLAAIAMPVFDPEGALVAAVSLTGLTPSIIRNGQPSFLDELRNAVRDISGNLYPGKAAPLHRAARAQSALSG
ncbi:IclR family transcriptional regulator [Azospirillum doebereinerae]|uniref:IclR family transcriptional regulator n=1 Tax=Azospirillum doebereinerae TaxID=92933 RepID=A0A433J7T1_9PROT|nr:IclR family transcriptional regulator [Azospirillum doebereinerae]MCG5243225.1 IclR family transcriptional regulator [Azospirillum doebereinerae]RUQ69713.1 IclR family transcriptional regulator [Azospirillum doebereinerae]